MQSRVMGSLHAVLALVTDIPPYVNVFELVEHPSIGGLLYHPPGRSKQTMSGITIITMRSVYTKLLGIVLVIRSRDIVHSYEALVLHLENR